MSDTRSPANEDHRKASAQLSEGIETCQNMVRDYRSLLLANGATSQDNAPVQDGEAGSASA